MEIQQMKCLIAVSKYKNFTKAADAMFMSQSSMSKIISSLEDEIGVPLVQRNRHRASMTHAGEYLADHAQQIIQSIERVEARTRRIGNGITGFLQIGVCEELDLNGLLPHFLRNFAVQNSSVEIDISIHNMVLLPEKVLTGDLDIAFVPNVLQKNASELISIPINRAAPRLYFSNDHPKAKKEDLSIRDFLKDSVLTLTSSADDTLKRLEALGYRFSSKLSVKSLQVMRLYIEANLGVAILGVSQSLFDSAKVQNIPIPLEDHLVGTDVIRLADPSNPVVNLFFSQLNSYLKSKPKCAR